MGDHARAAVALRIEKQRAARPSEELTGVENDEHIEQALRVEAERMGQSTLEHVRSVELQEPAEGAAAVVEVGAHRRQAGEQRRFAARAGIGAGLGRRTRLRAGSECQRTRQRNDRGSVRASAVPAHPPEVFPRPEAQPSSPEWYARCGP